MAAITPQQVAAQADDIMRELQRVDNPAGRPSERMSGIDILAALERDPNLRLEDILPDEQATPERMPPTLTGRENEEARPPVPPTGDVLFSAARGMTDPLGLVPQPDPRMEPRGVTTLTGEQAPDVAQEVRFGSVPEAQAVGSLIGFGPAAGAVREGAGAVARTIARHPAASAAIAAPTALTAAPAQTQQPTPPSPADSAQQALDQLMTNRKSLADRQTALRQDLTRFDSLRDSDVSAVREAQQLLGARGFDPGSTDGKMGRVTRIALRNYRQAVAAELQDVGGQLNGLGPNIQAAQKALGDARRAAAQQEGNERLRDVEADVPWGRQKLREYGPAMGYALGLLGIGPGIRWGVTRYKGEGAARAADALMGETRRDVPGRIGRVNEVWTRGQSPMFGSRQAPFTRDADSPAGFVPNPRAPEASAIYQPNRTREQLENVGVALGGAADWTVAQTVLIPRALEEERQARAALEKDPTSEANIRRLQAALDLKAIYQTLGNVGPGAIGGYAAGSHFMPRTHARPNVSAAEAERGRLDRLLNRGTAPTAPTATARPRPSPGDRPPEGSIWNESAQRWMGPAEPGRPGRPFLSGDYAPPRRRRTSE